MGMSSSQARLLNLTTRMHQIEYKAAKIEAQKLQMANESTRVYEDYLNALETSKIQYKKLTTDGSNTFIDATYGDLCLGGLTSSNSILTTNGRLLSATGNYLDTTATETATTLNFQYGLFSTQNGFMYVPEAIKTAYEESTDAEDFATRLADYTPQTTPSIIPSTPANPTTPSDDNGEVGGSDDNGEIGGSDDNGEVGGSDDNGEVGGSDDNGEVGGSDDNGEVGGSDDNGEVGGSDDNGEIGGSDDNGEVGGSDDNGEVGGSDDNGEVGGSDDNGEIGGSDDNGEVGGSDDNGEVGGSDDNGEVGNVDDDDDIPENIELPDHVNATLVRKNSLSNKITINSFSSNYVVKLTNAIDNKDLYYTISTGSSSITLEYLDNGRLLIQGNNAEVYATEGQADNLIVLGNSNIIDTNSGKDTVRVGLAIDSVNGISAQESDFNFISTGSGKDYVENLGYNEIDMGEGYDSLYDYENMLQNTAAQAEYGFSAPVGVENPFSSVKTNPTDNKLDWGMQGNYGDCKLLSFLNSLNKPLSDYVTITKNGSDYDVTFNNLETPVTVTASDLNNTTSAKGDIDFVVTELAFKKLIAGMGFNMNNTTNPTTAANSVGSSNNNFLISKAFFNGTKAGEANLTETNFRYLLGEWTSGNISSLVVGSRQSAYTSGGVYHPATGEENKKSGIYYNHAYAIKGGVEDQYVVLSNPHDSNDTITLDWSDFFKYFETVALFGDAYDSYVARFGNPEYLSVEHVASASGSGEVGTINVSLADKQKHNMYVNIYNAIKEAGGCIAISDDMVYNRTYLTNMINGGYAYLKSVKRDNSWADTSVATDTNLQEVTDEKLLKKAEAKYEADMLSIDRKERKYDRDLAALENERNAIKQEMETLKTVAKDNVERTFKLFS